MLFYSFFFRFVTCFLHNVAATVSYDRKGLLDIRIVITHLKLDEELFFNESGGRDILLQTPDQAQISVIRWRFSGKRSGCLVRIRRRMTNLPLPSVLLANVQSLENKWDELKARVSHQQDNKNCNILCFTESWLDDSKSGLYTPSVGQNSILW
jgi:hypothetical protein